MFESLKVERFRGFELLELPDLARVNLVVGANNSGKTALLEAILLLCGPGGFRADNDSESQLGEWFELTRRADIHSKNPENTVGWLFHRGDVTKSIRITATVAPSPATQGQRRRHVVDFKLADIPTGMLTNALQRRENPHWTFQLSVARPGGESSGPHDIQLNDGQLTNAHLQHQVPLACVTTGAPSRDLTRLSRWYSRVDQDGRHDELLKAMQRVESRLRRFSVTTPDGQRSILQADVGLGRLIPVSHLGDGFMKLLVLALKLSEARDGVLLIDEIETSFHRESLDRFWEFLRDAARELDVQVFATTHSWEAIEAAHATFKAKAPYDFAIYRLARDGDVASVTRLGEGPIDFALRTRFEIR